MRYRIYFWHRAPVFRLLLPFMAGILLQWNIQIPFSSLLYLMVFSGSASLLYGWMPIHRKFRRTFLSGILLNTLLMTAGALAIWYRDVRNNPHSLATKEKFSHSMIVSLKETPVEKPRSWKARATILTMNIAGRQEPVAGDIILYFKKDVLQSADYGTTFLLFKKPEQIRNSGNPGSFDYKTYCLRNGITHQVYLTEKDFVQLSSENKKWFNSFLFKTRSAVLAILRKYIPSSKEAGLAEALLIGYKDDLDKSLVKSYTDTGVVHVIAISGLHLGLIYGILMLLTRMLKRKKWMVLRLLLVLGGLWIFSFLAGAQASVLRSAVMFSCLAIGEVLNRRSSMVNSLAFSAFLLLLINPFLLWDAGFQLSYAAVLSLVLFYKPVYHWLYFPSKTIDVVWQSNAVTLSAQILTLPVSLYHFRQFPVLFLVTNLVAVPLSSMILISEIILCCVHMISPVAILLGNTIQSAIRIMNEYIERLNGTSIAVWEGISVSLFQVILLYLVIGATAIWLLEKKKSMAVLSAVSILVFITLRTFSFHRTSTQKMLIVYAVPGHQAVDLIDGHVYRFIGSNDLIESHPLFDYHIRPARTLYRLQTESRALPSPGFHFYGLHVFIPDYTAGSILHLKQADLLLLSGHSSVKPDLLEKVRFRQVVLDGSVPRWKARQWRAACENLGIACHYVVDKGAFVVNAQTPTFAPLTKNTEKQSL